MLAFMRKLQEARRRDEGASAVEYGLIIAAVAAVILVAVIAFGDFVGQLFENTCDSIQGQTPAGPTATECN